MRNRTEGFTLIELLVAIAVFSILALVAYGGLQSLLQGRDDVQREMQQLGELQIMFLNMQRDLEQFINRPLRGPYDEDIPGFMAGGNSLELTRAGWRNPMSRPRSHLIRVAYRLNGGRLERIYWNVLDRAQDTRPHSRVLLENVRAMRLRYLLPTGEWADQWAATDDNGEAAGPDAVEVILDVENWGQVRRIFNLTV